MTEDNVKKVAEAIREHIKVDATGLSPAVVGHFIFGFEEAARAAIAAMSEWRPIEEATAQDKDGKPVLGFCAPHIELMVFRHDKWRVANYPFGCLLEPTHLMTLPLPPEGE